eukprot:3146474-Rhodomonas_salina.1
MSPQGSHWPHRQPPFHPIPAGLPRAPQATPIPPRPSRAPLPLGANLLGNVVATVSGWRLALCIVNGLHGDAICVVIDSFVGVRVEMPIMLHQE